MGARTERTGRAEVVTAADADTDLAVARNHPGQVVWGCQEATDAPDASAGQRRDAELIGVLVRDALGGVARGGGALQSGVAGIARVRCVLEVPDQVVANQVVRMALRCHVELHALGKFPEAAARTLVVQKVERQLILRSRAVGRSSHRANRRCRQRLGYRIRSATGTTSATATGAGLGLRVGDRWVGGAAGAAACAAFTAAPTAARGERDQAGDRQRIEQDAKRCRVSVLFHERSTLRIKVTHRSKSILEPSM